MHHDLNDSKCIFQELDQQQTILSPHWWQWHKKEPSKPKPGVWGQKVCRCCRKTGWLTGLCNLSSSSYSQGPNPYEGDFHANETANKCSVARDSALCSSLPVWERNCLLPYPSPPSPTQWPPLLPGVETDCKAEEEFQLLKDDPKQISD